MAIQCPKVPALLPEGIPPPGSVQWCTWIESTLKFMEDLGVQIAQWLDKNLDYWQWYNALNAYRNSLIADARVPSLSTWVRILGWILDIFKEVGRGLDVGKQLISCLWELRKLVLPSANPEGYLGTVLIRDVLRSIRGLKLGSQSYLGFTVDAFFDMPALDQILDYLLAYMLPIEMPTATEATSAWSHGVIDQATRDCVWRFWGHSPKGYEPYVIAQTAALGVQQAIEYGRRTGNDPRTIEAALKRAGWIDEDQRARTLLLYDRLQSEGQSLQWDRRNVMDDGFVQKYGLDAGFTDKYWPRVGDDLVAQGITQEIAKRNYYDHWTPVSASTLSEMVYRLRKDNPNVTASYDETDYRANLLAQGHTPYMVDRLTQLLHRPLSISEAQNLWYRGLLDSVSLKAAFQAAGYGDIAAQVLMDREPILRNQWRAREYGGWTPQRAGRAYAIGLLTHQQVTAVLTPLGADAQAIASLESASTADYQYRIRNRAISRLLTLTVTQVRQSIAVGVMDEPSATAALTAVGWPAQQAAGIARIESATARISLVKQTVSRLRSALLAGEVTLTYAEHALGQLGITPGAVAQYIALWQIQNTPGRKRRTAGSIVTDLAEGTLTVGDATARLTALGYSQPEILLYLADAERKMVRTPAAVAAEIETAPSKKIAQAETHGAFLPGISKRVVAELMRQESPAALKKYIKDGIVSQQYAAMRLELYGWEPASIDKWLRETTPPPEAGSDTTTTTPATAASSSDSAATAP